MDNTKKAFFWFRRDLRLDDNRGLFFALKSQQNVQPIFIFDKNILDKLSNKKDKRVKFIYEQVSELKKELNKLGSDLQVYYGNPETVFKDEIKSISAVYSNKDYEPYALKRDKQIQVLCSQNDIIFKQFKDQVIFEENDILKKDGKPYTVYTPYKNKWLEKLTDQDLVNYDVITLKNSLNKTGKTSKLLKLSEMGFEDVSYIAPQKKISKELLLSYADKRDIPSLPATSKLGIHLRFGTVSVRQLAKKAKGTSAVWLSELIWREFFMAILFHFPKVVNKAFKPAYDHIEWINNEDHFKAWCEGNTGYPIVDAGMRELNETGFMHNRVRMVAASFLTKHLLTDWRWGEAYFAEKLLDYDLSANVGNWQWAAGSGCDASPYFRVFNPELQTKKFDPNLLYVKKWVPEFEDPFTYVKPIVEHSFARDRAIKTYKKGLAEARS